MVEPPRFRRFILHPRLHAGYPNISVQGSERKCSIIVAPFYRRSVLRRGKHAGLMRLALHCLEAFWRLLRSINGCNGLTWMLGSGGIHIRLCRTFGEGLEGAGASFRDLRPAPARPKYPLQSRHVYQLGQHNRGPPSIGPASTDPGLAKPIS